LQGPLIAEAHHFVVIDDQNLGLFAHGSHLGIGSLFLGSA
jgi:hypothetical protein